MRMVERTTLERANGATGPYFSLLTLWNEALTVTSFLRRPHPLLLNQGSAITTVV